MSEAHALMLIAAVLLAAGIGQMTWWIVTESRQWRHLVQLYYEARLHRQLPVYQPKGDEPVSSLTLPKDIQAELARRDAERDE